MDPNPELPVQKLGKMHLFTDACDASQLMKQRNVGEAKSALVKAAMGVVKQIDEITKLKERYKAVQDF